MNGNRVIWLVKLAKHLLVIGRRLYHVTKNARKPKRIVLQKKNKIFINWQPWCTIREMIHWSLETGLTKKHKCVMMGANVHNIEEKKHCKWGKIGK